MWLAEIAANAGDVTDVWLCSDGRHVICQIGYQCAERWNFRTGRLVCVYDCAYAFEFDRTLRLAIEGPELILELVKELGECIEGAAISENGKLAATVVDVCDTSSVLIWDTAPPTNARRLQTRGKDRGPEGVAALRTRRCRSPRAVSGSRSRTRGPTSICSGPTEAGATCRFDQVSQTGLSDHCRFGRSDR